MQDRQQLLNTLLCDSFLRATRRSRRPSTELLKRQRVPLGRGQHLDLDASGVPERRLRPGHFAELLHCRRRRLVERGPNDRHGVADAVAVRDRHDTGARAGHRARLAYRLLFANKGPVRWPRPGLLTDSADSWIASARRIVEKHDLLHYWTSAATIALVKGAGRIVQRSRGVSQAGMLVQ